jgi:hypothetical protein
MLARGPGQVIIYHLLCEGRAYFQSPDGARIALSAGDLITFPHGNGHVLGAGPFFGGLPTMIKVSIRDDVTGQWLENSLKFLLAHAANEIQGSKILCTEQPE